MIRLSRLVLVVVLAVTTAVLADNLSYVRLDSGVVEGRTQLSPQDASARLTMLKGQFTSAGCSDKLLKEQAVPGQQLPNLVCVLPGLEDGAIVVGASYDYLSTGDAARVDWATVSMLPLMVESLKSVAHRYTFIFVAFSGHDQLAGSAYYLQQLSDAQRVGIRAMVDLNQIGRGPAMYSIPQFKPPAGTERIANLSAEDNAPRADNVLSKLLPASARAIKQDAPAELKEAALTDAQSFDGAYILALTVTSASSSNAVDATAYYNTYNLLCLYTLVLDRALGPAMAPTPKTTTIVAENKAPGTPAPAATSTATPTAVSPGPTGSQSANSFDRGAGNAQTTITSAMPVAATTSGTPLIRTTTRLVQIDVVVTDNKGLPIQGLKAGDFTLLQDGKPQQVKVFEAHLPRPSDAKLVRAANPMLPQNTYTNLPRDASDNSWNIILVDLLNTETKDQQIVRGQLIKLVKSLPPGRPVALFQLNSNHLEMLEGFTDEPADLVKAAEAIRPEQSPLMISEAARQHEKGTTESAERYAMAGPSGQGVTDATSQQIKGNAEDRMREQEQAQRNTESYSVGQRVNFTLDAFKTLTRTVVGYPGRKNLIWLSAGFPVRLEPDANFTQREWQNASDYTRQLAYVSTQVATARIAVYPVDVRGMTTRGMDISMGAAEGASFSTPGAATIGNTSTIDPMGGLLNTQSQQNSNEFDAMRDIADQTGGHAFLNNNDLRTAIARSIDNGSIYYTLAYTPEKDDGKLTYHRVDVKLDQPSAKLSYRKGYFSEPPTNTQPAAGVAALQGAMNPGTPQSTALYMTVAVLPPDATHRMVRILYNINPNGVTFTDLANKAKHTQVDCMVVAYNAKGVAAAHASDTLDATIGPAQFEQVMSRGLPAQQEIELPPGNYTLRFGVMDRATQKIGTVDAPLSVSAQVASK